MVISFMAFPCSLPLSLSPSLYLSISLHLLSSTNNQLICFYSTIPYCIEIDTSHPSLNPSNQSTSFGNMLFSLPTLALVLAVTAAAAPYSQQEERRESDILGGFYDSWSRKGHNFRAATTARAAEQCKCDTSSIEMPQGMFFR